MRRPLTAIVLLAITAACLAVAVALPNEDWPLGSIVALGAVLLFTTAVGALIAYRRHENNVGWILVGIGLSLSSGLGATQYANRALEDAPGSLPFGVVAAWFQSWLWTPLVALFALLILLFPTGAPPSRRWRVVGWAALGLTAAATLTQAFRPGAFETFPKVENPLGVSILEPIAPLFDAITPVVISIYLAAVASIVVRFRRSHGTERQQLKWFAYAVVVAVLLAALNPIFLWNSNVSSGLSLALGLGGPLLAFLLLPSSIGISILRHRLYDIDRIVSRTFSYAIVTAILGGVFVVVALLPTIAVGTEDAPDWLIAIATLLIAALFRPVRRRVQSAVDRRFNRSRYNAAHTIEAFNAHLREQVDIDELGVELRDVIFRTMQPAHVSLWIKQTV